MSLVGSFYGVTDSQIDVLGLSGFSETSLVFSDVTVVRCLSPKNKERGECGSLRP